MAKILIGIEINQQLTDLDFQIDLADDVIEQIAYSGDTRSPIPVISVHSVGNLQYRRQS